MSKKKKDKSRSTQQLMGIVGLKDHGIATGMGDLVFYIIKPTNISVLPEQSVMARTHALMNLIRSLTEMEMLALNARESFERNKIFDRERRETEELPAIQKLLEQDSRHLDSIQIMMASSREFYIALRLREPNEADLHTILSGVEESIHANGFTARRANAQDLKRMLAVYFEQNVTTELFEDHDGDRWIPTEA